MSGSWSEKETDSYKAEFTWVFSDEEISELREEKEVLKTCGNGIWRLSAELDPDSENRSVDKPLFCAVQALPQEEDVQQGTSTNGWVRIGKYNIEVTAISGEAPRGHILEPLKYDHKFTSSNRFAGLDDFGRSFGELLKLCKNDKLGIRCTITSSHRPTPTPLSSQTLLSFFDNTETADTAFRWRDSDGETLHILVCKHVLVAASPHFRALFEGATLSQEVIDLNAFKEERHGLSRNQTERELTPFWQPKLTEGSSEHDEQSDGEPRLDNAVNAEVANAVESTKENDSTEERPSKKVKLETPAESSKSDDKKEGKLLTVVEVHEPDFEAYRCMLAYLHAPKVVFYSVTSKFLVRLQDADNSEDLFEEHPADWFSTDITERLILDDTPQCSVYEMYRLAEKYDMKDLRELSLNFIVRSLNSENAAYELFSPLSLEKKEVQEAILKFFVKHWLKVKKTKAFKHVLDKFSSGELANGRDLMEKIFDLMKA